MADITKVKLPNGTTYDIKDSGALPLTGGTVTGPVSFQDSTSMDEATIGDLIVNGGANFINGINATNYSGGQPIYIVKGTQTTTTASWTGEIHASKLYDGMTIAYYLPRTSATNVTLNLTLLDGTTTGAIPVYITSATRMGTHYNAGSTVYLTYWSAGSILINGTATTEARWTSNDYWNSNTYDRTYLSNSGYKVGSTAIVSGNIIVAGTDGLYKHLKAGTVFDITMPILYAGSNASANTVNNGGYICIPFNVTTTQSITLTAYKPLFIKGTLSGVNFTPISTAPLTQTIPTSADNYQYIYLGYATTTTVAYLLPEHPIYEYRNEAFQRVVGDAKTVNSHTVLSDVPANAVFTDTTYSDVTTSVHGLMTAADKVKLNKYPLTSNSQNGYLLKVNSSGNVEASNITVDTALTQSELDTVLTGSATPASYYSVVNRNDIDAMTSKLVELNAPTRLTSGGTEGTTYGAPPLVLLHFSDIHGDSQRVQNIVNFKSYYAGKINDIICTGDIVNYSVEDGLGFWTGVSGSENILTCIGNHDSCMVNASDRTGSNWMKYTMSECYQMYMADNIASWGATYTSGQTYYYKDYTTQGVRLIVLDIMRNQSDSNQLTWFTNTLTSARTAGLHVIVALHGHAHWRYMPYDTPWDTAKLAPGKPTSQDHYEYYPAEGYAYMGGTSSWADKSTASRGTDDTSGYPSNLGTSYMMAVQDFIDAGGNFVCWLHGHTHYKMFARLLYFPDQLDVSVAQAGCPPFADSYTNYREEDTRTEDDFELVAVDTESKILRIAQVGIDHDKYMRPWESISYNYGTHELMSPAEDQQTDLLFEGTFKNGSAALTLPNAMRYKQLVIVGKSGAATSTTSGTEYRINSVRTITTSALTTSAANNTLTGSDGTFTFSLKYSGSNIVVTYVSETTSGKGAITAIYGHM